MPRLMTSSQRREIKKTEGMERQAEWNLQQRIAAIERLPKCVGIDCSERIHTKLKPNDVPLCGACREKENPKPPIKQIHDEEWRTMMDKRVKNLIRYGTPEPTKKIKPPTKKALKQIEIDKRIARAQKNQLQTGKKTDIIIEGVKVK